MSNDPQDIQPETAPIADASRNDSLDDSQTVATSEEAENNAAVSPDVAARLLLAAIGRMDDVVLEVRGEAWHNQSPCDEWDAERVLRHVTGNLQRTHELLNAGGAYGNDTDPSASALVDEDDDSARSEWRQASLRITEALGEADLTASVEDLGQTVTIAEALGRPTYDVAIHSWDVAVAVGADRELPDELLDGLEKFVASIPDDFMRSSGFFAEPKKAPKGASRTDRIMARLGRTVPDNQ